MPMPLMQTRFESRAFVCVRVRIALWLGRWPSARAPSSAANRMDM